MMKFWMPSLLLLFANFPLLILAEDPPTPQVTVETKFVEVRQDFEKELGFEFGAGPVVSHMTNGEDVSNVTGITVQGGVDVLLNPILGVFGHAKFSQFGEKYKNPFADYQFKISKFAVDGGVKIHFVPNKKVVPFIIVGLDVGVNTFATQTVKADGEKEKEFFKLNDDENRAFVGVMGGAGVTVRTDVVDMTLQAQVIGGVVEPITEFEERRVPILAEIPLIMRFFRPKEKQRNRENLLILIKANIIESEEP